MDENYQPDEMRDEPMHDSEFGERMPERDDPAQTDASEQQTTMPDGSSAPKSEDSFGDKVQDMGDEVKDRFKL